MGGSDRGRVISLPEAFGSTIMEPLPPPVEGDRSRLVLLVYSPHGLLEIGVEPGRQLVIGRASSCDIQIDHPSLSRQHAVLQIVEGDQLYLRDLGSKNGSYASGVRLFEEVVPIGPGDHLRFGNVWARIVRVPRARRSLDAFLPPALFETLFQSEVERALLLRQRVALAVIKHRRSSERVRQLVEPLLSPTEVACLVDDQRCNVLFRAGDPDATLDACRRIAQALQTDGGESSVGFAVMPDHADSCATLRMAASVACSGPGSREKRAEGAVRVVPLTGGELVLAGPQMLAIGAHLEWLAVSSCHVRLEGESGVGKDLLAEHLHDLSPRADHPFMKLDCSALAGPALTQELFGRDSKPGLLELAGRGTLYIDGFVELPLEAQGRLCRALETRTAARLGAPFEHAIDVRVILSSSRPPREHASPVHPELLDQVHASVVIPPLRDRRIEIATLAHHFLRKAVAGSAGIHVGPDALRALWSYGWPGNVRELAQAMRAAAVRVNGDAMVRPRHLPGKIAEAGGFVDTGGVPVELDGSPEITGVIDID